MKKINRTFCILIILLYFVSCKKKYTCACNVYIHYYYGISPPSEFKKYYNTSSTIDQKMTQKKAKKACKDIEELYIKSITPSGSPYSITEVSGGCELK